MAENFFRGGCSLNKQTITIHVTVKDGVATDIGRSYTIHPEIRFNGNSIKWYEDRKNRSVKK